MRDLMILIDNSDAAFMAMVAVGVTIMILAWIVPGVVAKRRIRKS